MLQNAPELKYEEREVSDTQITERLFAYSLSLFQKFWNDRGIKCFEPWTIPYFVQRDKERKRPCLRLNHPSGICVACQDGSCKFEKGCFFCGKEGHGAFQVHPGGKLKGQLRCSKHRNFVNQLEILKTEYHVSEKDLQRMFGLSPMKMGLLRDQDEEGFEETHESMEESTQPAPTHENKNDTSVTDISSLMSFQVCKTTMATPESHKGPPAASIITPDPPRSNGGHISRSFSHDPSGTKSKFEGLFVHSNDADLAAPMNKSWTASMSPRIGLPNEMPLFATNSLAAAMEAISFMDPMQIINTNPMAGMSVVDISDTDFYDEHFTLRFKGDAVRLGEVG